MKKKLPTWHTEALEQGIDFIVLVYGKAEGFVFCPSNLEEPFRVGGDYGGCFPTDADGAQRHFDHYINKAYRNQVSWFMPYVQRVRMGQDFSLDRLKIDERELHVIKGRWPW